MPIKRKRPRSIEDSSDESDIEVDVEEISDSNSDARTSPSSGKRPLVRHKKKKIVSSKEGKRRSNRSSTKGQSRGGDECGICFEENKNEEQLLTCSDCAAVYHMSCLNLSKKVLTWLKRSSWKCKDCKMCETCNQTGSKMQLVICDVCDQAFHLSCLTPQLNSAPSDEWLCTECAATVSREITLKSTNKQATDAVKRKRGRPRKVEPTSETSQTDIESENLTSLEETPVSLPSRGHKSEKKVKFKKCPMPGCDGQGHMTGRFEMHHTISGCPKYHNITPEECKKKAKEREKETAVCPESKEKIKSRVPIKERPKKALRSKVQLSFMPEKIRAAVTSKEITPEEHNLQQAGARKSSLQSAESYFLNPSLSESGISHSVTEELDEEALQEIAPGNDFVMFKQAWTKSLEANEEEVLPMNGRLGCRCIEFGSFEIDTWYTSPYPEEFQRLKRLYICEFCLKYMKSQTILRRHAAKCNRRYPPGDEIYRKNSLCIFEVDGKHHKGYCQNLCLLAKLFLDHKTLYYDVEPFLFYVMTKADSTGCHMIGYFSKEKKSFLNYNVSCILTLPMYMKQGYGKMLIDFSYLLSKTEDKVGSPEKPLSDLGLISYRSYWKGILIKYLKTFGFDRISIKDISQETALHPSDIVSTLQYLGILKYWKGKHVILRATELFDDYDRKVSSRPSGFQEIDPACLSWTPPSIQD